MSCYDCMYIVYIIMYVIKKLACKINKHQTIQCLFIFFVICIFLLLLSFTVFC